MARSSYGIVRGEDLSRFRWVPLGFVVAGVLGCIMMASLALIGINIWVV